MEPQIHVSWLGIALAIVANMVFGFLWFGPLFGKKWAKGMGFPDDFKPAPGAFARAIVLQAIGAFLLAYVLTHSQQIWRASVWDRGADGPDWGYGCMSAFFTWLGFFLPIRFGMVGWENKGWGLFGIHVTHDFIALQIIAMILAYTF